MCFSRRGIEVPAPSEYDQQMKRFMDGLVKPVCEFAVDAERERVLFKGGFSLDGAHSKLVIALLPNHRSGKAKNPAEVAFLRTEELAASLAVEEASLRQQLKSLRDHDDRAAEELRKAYDGIDEVLDARQQARFRLFEERLELRKLDLLMRARQGAARRVK